MSGLIIIYVLAMILYLIFRTILGGDFRWLGLLNEFVWLLFLPVPLTFSLSLILKNWPALVGNLFLIAIALIWFGPDYLPNSPPTPTNLTLKVLTFNIWIYNEHLDDVKAWLEETEPDIVLLQETTSRLVNGDSAINNRFPYQATKKGSSERFGSLILSRYPILSEESLANLGDHGLQRYTIDVDGRTIAIYNAHMPQPLGDSQRPISHEDFFIQNILSYNNARRDEQIRRLIQLAEIEEYPLIIGGDFNMSDQAVIYDEISAVMTDSYREVGSGSGRSWPVLILDDLSPLIPPLLRVDYIWHSQQLRAVEAHLGPELGSDHLPLVAELELLD